MFLDQLPRSPSLSAPSSLEKPRERERERERERVTKKKLKPAVEGSSSGGKAKRKRIYIPTGRPRGRPRKNPEGGTGAEIYPPTNSISVTEKATGEDNISYIEEPSLSTPITTSSGRSVVAPVTRVDLPKGSPGAIEESPLTPGAAAVGGRNMELVPLSQTKNFMSATLENEKGDPVFSEEKKKRGPRKKKDEKEWQPFEMISLYAVHKQVDSETKDFWKVVAAGMKTKGHAKTGEECRLRWEQALVETDSRVKAKQEGEAKNGTALDSANGNKIKERRNRDGDTPEKSCDSPSQATTRSSPRLRS